MPDIKISQLPAGTANASAVVPATNAAGTTTEKITLESIVGLAHQHTISQVTDLETTLGQKLDAPESATAGDVLTYEDGSWVAAAASGGGGGGDYLPLAGGTMTGNIAFDGTSGQAIGKGWFDTERGGNYGISLYCSIGYQLNWQAGWLICTEQDLTTPRPLYLDGEEGTTLRVWGASENEGVEVSHTGITFADGTTQTTAAASLPTSANTNDVLAWNGSAWAAVYPSTPGLPSGSSGQFLKYDGTNWVAGSLTSSTASAGQFLQYDGTNWVAAAFTISDYSASAGYSVGDLVSHQNTIWRATNPGMGNEPQTGGSYWVNVSGVDESELPTATATGDVVTWDGSAWVAQQPAGGGGGYTAPLFARMTNDEQYMSVAASSNLTLSPIAGSATYYIEGLAVIEGQADAVIGLKLSSGTSDGEVLLDHDYLHDAGNNEWSTNRNIDQTNSTAAYNNGNSWMSTVTAPIRFRGWVTTGAISSTNIALHFGSTSNMATITLKAGSWITATKIA